MFSVMLWTLLVHILTCYSGLCQHMIACAAVVHYSRVAQRTTPSPLASRMKLGNSPMSLLAHVVQERSNICTAFVARRKQAQEHYGHLLVVSRDCSDVSKRKCYHNLQEALREATSD